MTRQSASTRSPVKDVSREPAPGPGELSTEVLNRELSWLEFNRRVLHQAHDERTPLLERLRFLGIFTSNLDEFYMKRVGGLKRQIVANVYTRSADGRTAAQTMVEIRKAVLPMLHEQARIYRQEILPELARNRIDLLKWSQLVKAEKEEAQRYFRSNVFPVLTPLTVDPGHPFPFISNLSTSLGVMMENPDGGEPLFARVKVPKVLPQWILLKTGRQDSKARMLSLTELIEANLPELFPDMKILATTIFRITRNADIERDEEDAEDLLDLIEQELRRRRFEKVVRLEHGPNPDPWMLQTLMQELELAESDVYAMPAELDYQSFKAVTDMNIPALRFEPWTPATPPRLADERADIFAVIRNGDLLAHHPYEDFNASVTQFIRAAAADPKVLAIKMTIYRTGEDSPFIPLLIRSAESGKQVVCLVELKARFDEERNIVWAQALEKAGVHVVYGIVGLKTHNKTTLVVRQEGEELRCYAHIGTGNYHTQTARLYTDLGLFTCRKELTDDLLELFHSLTSRSLHRQYRKLLVAPVNMKDRFVEMIRREVRHSQEGKPSRIVAKMNSLEDGTIVRELYAASQAGVPIDLIVRGFCCLRPGVAGLSENIRVLSVVGRFLEHSRIFYFRNAAAQEIDGEFYIGSADWMYRNLQGRVEAITPVEDRPSREKCWEILCTILQDRCQGWDMQADGSYKLRLPEGPDQLPSQTTLMNLTRSRVLIAAEPPGPPLQ